MTTQFDAIIIGTGQAGPPWRDGLARAGTRSRSSSARLRRHLRQHRLHSDQDAGRQRLCGALARRGADFGVIVDGPIQVDMKRSRRARTRSSGRSTKASRAG